MNQERQAALLEAAHAQRILQFTLNLFSAGPGNVGQPSDLRASDLLARGLQEAQALQGDPLRQSEIFMTLGEVSQNNNDYGKAEESIQAAWTARKQIPGDAAAVLAAQSQIALGSLRIDQNRYEEAEKNIREGLATLERLRGPSDPDLLRAKLSLAEVVMARGSVVSAIQILEPIVRAQQTNGSSDLDRAPGTFDLGLGYFRTGDYDRAERSMNSSLSAYHSLYGSVHPSIAWAEQLLCQIDRDRNVLVDAERHCRAAVSIAQAWYGPKGATGASTIRALGVVLTKENKLDEARPLLQRALALTEEQGQEGEGLAIALQSLADNEYHSTNYAGAEEHGNRALAILQKIYGTDHHFNVAVTESLLAGVANKQRDNARAELLIRHALVTFLDLQGPEGTKTAVAHAQLGHVLLSEHKYTEAKQESKIGYDLLLKQSVIQDEFLDMSKNDLAAENAAITVP